ncbi:hypothetical protein E4U03_03720 [Rothia nasimurium]|uniref:Uncharacterized protein n=1 Tax=Rothia nasimurium TaxID=85336 RepID=A0A4Y9F512_9MICC|nr:hypothetical protein [Rothia nasimurium]MBF0807726.1 hypothetical protein [Rothia nasimurium]TFU23243.1 hypothetical protein E4U03_03720 [Rothia nasimurium]
MSTTTENQQPLKRRISITAWALILLTVLLALSTLVLGIGYSKTQAELKTAQDNVVSLENTIQTQQATIETYQVDTQYWSVEEQNNAIAVAAAAVGVERRGPERDFEAYLFHIESYGTDNFRTQMDGTRNGLKTRGIVRLVESTDFSQADKAIVRIGSSGVIGGREPRGFYDVTLIKADDGSILVDSFSGVTYQ